jgi:hypothetical protein
MRHVFKATGMGWTPDREGIWFDADHYTKEGAEAQFKLVEKISKEGWPYTAYEYEGDTFRYVQYLGLFDDDGMPNND